ncbi:MAG: hypothetical protein KDE19_24000 [Caldilineaceae bacterium]|nr:hypothetical protein [Caldilineaceae bacterium]
MQRILSLFLLSVLIVACVPVAPAGTIPENNAAGSAAEETPATAEEPASEEGALEPVHADFDPANFTNATVIDNEWSPLLPGMQWVYEGESLDGDEMVSHRIEFTVTDLTKEIDGVRAVVAWVVDIMNGEEIVESELSFYAQDDQGAVWYLGEYPEEYEEGELVAAPTWISGMEEAKAGVKMVKDPQVGQTVYFQGWGPAVEWSDFGIVKEFADEVCVPVDCYQDVLVIDETSLDEVEAGAFQQKFYARGIGNMHVEWTGEDANQETLDMVEFVAQIDAETMADVRALALEQEARAYENSPDVYGATTPME